MLTKAAAFSASACAECFLHLCVTTTGAAIPLLLKADGAESDTKGKMSQHSSVTAVDVHTATTVGTDN